MNSFYLAFSVVFPLFVYMVIGGIVKKLKLYSYESFRSLNGLIFKLLIPLTLFIDVYKADIGDAFQPGVFAFVFFSTLITWAACWVFFSKTIDDIPDQATMIQGVYRSNFVLFGTTIAAALCDDAGVALVAALCAMTVPMFNILSVITFEVKRGGSAKPSQLIISIFRNPLVDAALIALIFHLLPFRLPDLLLSPLSKLASCASPMALVTLGGMLSFGSMVQHRKYLVQAVLGRLIIVPLIVLALAILLGFRGNALVAILSIFASPTAVASGPMAQAMGGNGPLAGEIVALTSVICILTIFLIVFELSSIGMI